MKVTRTTRTIELTVQETHSITVSRKRKTVSRASDPVEADRISKIEQRTAETSTITTERDGSRNHD